ncbi:hypothetical protein AAC387_Pa12g1568 [Persea americana]
MKESEAFDEFNTKLSKIDLSSLTVEELIGNLQTFESNHCQAIKGKDIALVSSKSIDDNEDSDSSSDDAQFEAYFARKFKKMWNKKNAFPKKEAFSKKDSTYPKAASKGKFVPKTERDNAKGQENDRLLQQSQKIEAELVNLQKELLTCTSEKENCAGKLKMALAELNSAKASINRMNSGSMKLTEILGSQKSASSKTGIGYVQGASSSKDKGKSIFVQGPTMTAIPPILSNAIHPTSSQKFKRHVPKPNFIPICHLCGIKGHIKPYCNKMRNFQRNQQKKHYVTPQQVKTKTKTIWVRKSDIHCQVDFTTLSAQESDVWYLDSGCSRHMTGNKALFTHLEDYNGGSVRFGDGDLDMEVPNKTLDSQSDLESETEKKTRVKGDNADQHIGSSESLVPEIIRQFEEKSASKSSTSVPNVEQAAPSPVPHPRSRRGQVLRDHKNTVISPITNPMKTRTQVYVNDIVFGSTSESLSNRFGKKMSSEFEMSMVGEL